MVSFPETLIDPTVFSCLSFLGNLSKDVFEGLRQPEVRPFLI